VSRAARVNRFLQSMSVANFVAAEVVCLTRGARFLLSRSLRVNASLQKVFSESRSEAKTPKSFSPALLNAAADVFRLDARGG